MRRPRLAPRLAVALLALAAIAPGAGAQMRDDVRTVTAERSPALAARLVSVRPISARGAAPAGAAPAVTGASGLARLGAWTWIVQDDSNFLAALSDAGAVETVRLFEPVDGADRFHDALGNKGAKPDLEAIALLDGAAASRAGAKAGGALLVMGSGSVPGYRDRAAIVIPGARPAASAVVASRPRALYARLRADERLTGGAPLNVEGLALVGGGRYVRIFNRGIGPGGAVTSSVDVLAEALVDYLVAAARDPDRPFEAPLENATRYVAGEVAGVSLSLGDAAVLRLERGGRAAEAVVVPLTAEDTDDPTKDGATAGTHVAFSLPGGRLLVAPLVDAAGRPASIKIEGLLPRRVSWSGTPGDVRRLEASFLCVVDTDPDDPRVPSSLAEVEVVYDARNK